MELAVEISLFYLGMTIGYGTPHTLTPTSVKMKQTTPPQKGDAMALSPTVMVFAPAVLDKVRRARGELGVAPARARTSRR